jgi:hypothetical protein
MTADAFRRLALGLARAVEGEHMGHPDFRVDGRIFATLHADTKYGMVALTPEQQQTFVRQSTAFTPENGAWGRQGSTRVELRTVESETLGEAMTLAWQNAVAKNLARRPASPRSSVKKQKKAPR